MVCFFNLEDAREYALMAKKRVLHYGTKRQMYGRGGGSLQSNTNAIRGSRNDQIDK